ncbi:MAG TPA: penicillin-binding transpeptidase domain-containing protein, partial [Pyrinomonadaceae bacterium]
DREMAQLFGSERGDAGIERALFGVQSGAAPEAIDVLFERDIKQPANLDVRLTIDSELQKAAVEQLRDRHGAVVVLNPQTGEVLAMYSNPTYTLAEVQDEGNWIKLDADKRNSPLVNRSLRSYYIPGSTFKTVTMIAQYLAGTQNDKYLCSGNGYYAQPGAKVIYDDQGPAEVHGHIGVDTAYEVSCNQYFAQAAVKMGAERLKQAAQLIGIGAYDTPEEATRGRRQTEIWNTSSTALARALAPSEATIVTGAKMRPYDLAIEGFGQGYAGQMTPFQMALAAAAIANLEGKLMKPKIEFNQPPAVFNQVVSPDKAADMRRIMGLVTGGSSGTARGVFGPVQAAGITSGGKTGTAQKDVPEYDPKTGEPKTVKKYERDRRGNVIREYRQIVISEEKRIDSWFLCIAPLDYPQLAMAVIVEGGGYGSRAAAPIAAALVLRAKELGLLGNIQGAPNGQPQTQQQPQAQPNGGRQPSAPRNGQPTQPQPRPSQPKPTPRAVAVRQ